VAFNFPSNFKKCGFFSELQTVGSSLCKSMVQLLYPNQEEDPVHNDEIGRTADCSGSIFSGNSGNIHGCNWNSILGCLSLDSVFILGYKLGGILYSTHEVLHLILQTDQLQSCKTHDN
jgi:hypothetical protein